MFKKHVRQCLRTCLIMLITHSLNGTIMKHGQTVSAGEQWQNTVKRCPVTPSNITVWDNVWRCFSVQHLTVFDHVEGVPILLPLGVKFVSKLCSINPWKHKSSVTFHTRAFTIHNNQNSWWMFTLYLLILSPPSQFTNLCSTFLHILREKQRWLPFLVANLKMAAILIFATVLGNVWRCFLVQHLMVFAECSQVFCLWYNLYQSYVHRNITHQ